jgi:hypothetical protein
LVDQNKRKKILCQKEKIFVIILKATRKNKTLKNITKYIKALG